MFEKKWKKKKMKDDTNTFFVFTDFWVLGLFLYCIVDCYFVNQFDTRKSGTLV